MFTRLVFTPGPRHAKGFGGTCDLLIALGALAAGVGLLAKGEIVGLVPLLVFVPLFGRETYLKYTAGNWP